VTNLIEAYITIHDQDLLLECERSGQFEGLSHTYLFVGPRPIDRIPSDVKVVVSRDYQPNYEYLPQFYDYTGWFTLARHNLIESKFAIMIQYDHFLAVADAPERCMEALQGGAGVVAFVPGYYNNWYLQIEGFAEVLQACSLACGVDLPALEAANPFNQWPSTQGTAWNVDYFKAFMEWVHPIFDLAQEHVLAGHAAERMLNIYTKITSEPAYLPGLFRHDSKDCHGTSDFMRGDMDSFERKNREFLCL
jgi:hypothetical protein